MNCNVVVSERMNRLSFCLDRSTGRSTSALRRMRHHLAWETSHPIVRGVYVLMPEGLWNVWTEWSGGEWWKEIFIGSDDGVSAFCLVAMEMGSATGREMVPHREGAPTTTGRISAKDTFSLSITHKNAVMLSFAQVAKRSAAVSFRRQAVASRSE